MWDVGWEDRGALLASPLFPLHGHGAHQVLRPGCGGHQRTESEIVQKTELPYLLSQPVFIKYLFGVIC